MSDEFIKIVEKPDMTAEQKAILNRKGNALFNTGDVEGARRIYQTTGYSDGLSRVGDAYRNQGRIMDALRMYWIAPDHTKADAIIERLSGVIHGLLSDEERPND